ncbi:hypothetical protein DERF_011240 [Dermatophagoides farinae]|uniref:Uncharacterized protein n=1 Tax=Dermatophagoides farinae TaxID=6954 RepID=A0A922HRU3_DERFA|nr:hypothetical protein DERF_011240 [Dermatophagoides farinae]
MDSANQFGNNKIHPYFTSQLRHTTLIVPFEIDPIFAVHVQDNVQILSVVRDSISQLFAGNPK